MVQLNKFSSHSCIRLFKRPDDKPSKFWDYQPPTMDKTSQNTPQISIYQLSPTKWVVVRVNQWSLWILNDKLPYYHPLNEWLIRTTNVYQWWDYSLPILDKTFKRHLKHQIPFFPPLTEWLLGVANNNST